MAKLLVEVECGDCPSLCVTLDEPLGKTPMAWADCAKWKTEISGQRGRWFRCPACLAAESRAKEKP